ncbi:MAG: hypothetical protein GWO20_20740, partial [Candidatus Korarchaeota archaeon]|nr:hypothetical protein [Candidatus Korarchaeota archaeon]
MTGETIVVKGKESTGENGFVYLEMIANDVELTDSMREDILNEFNGLPKEVREAFYKGEKSAKEIIDESTDEEYR